MPSFYALVDAADSIDRIEPSSRINPGVLTRPGWRWLPVVDETKPSISGLQTAARTETVSANEVVRGWSVSTRAPTVADVDSERDRRLSTFPFGGRSYQFDNESQVNVAGAGTLSLAAIIAGKLANDLRWADPDKDFAWLAADNTIVTMDAQTTLAFAQAAARWKADHIHAARAIKNLSPIPADYAADVRWPT